jgi:hypothetical protein
MRKQVSGVCGVVVRTRTAVDKPWLSALSIQGMFARCGVWLRRDPVGSAQSRRGPNVAVVQAEEVKLVFGE